MKIEEEIKGWFRNDYHKGLINLVYTSNFVHYEFLQFLKKHGLTSQQYNVLRILRGNRSEPRSIDFLRERMLDKNSDISRIVDKLFNKELIDRIESKTDRRQKEITITNNGLELLTIIDDSERKVDTFLANLSLDEIQLLNNLLDKIRDRNN